MELYNYFHSAEDASEILIAPDSVRCLLVLFLIILYIIGYLVSIYYYMFLGFTFFKFCWNQEE